MAGTLQGQPVVFTERDTDHPKNQAIFESPFNQDAVVQDLGPRARRVNLAFYLEPPDMDWQARAIADLVSYTGFHVVTDASGIYYQDGHAFLRLGAIRYDRELRLTRARAPGVYLGNNQTHRLGVLATSRQLPNVWALAGRTALRAPTGCVLEEEAFTDAARRVVRTPAAFASHDADYEANRTTRSVGAAMRCHVAAPQVLFEETVRSLVGGRIARGGGHALAGEVVRSPALDVLFDAGQDKLTFTDRLAALGSYSLDVAAYSRAAVAGSALPATPQRHRVVLDNGMTLTIHDNGNVHLRPAGKVFKAAGGAQRALGTGVYWYSPAANVYLVGTADFKVAADGTVEYGEVTLGAEKLSNPGFEAFPDPAGVPTNWTSMGGGGVAFARQESGVHGGDFALKVTAGGASDQGVKQTMAGLTAGVLTYVEAYAKTNGGASEQARLLIRNVTDAEDVATVDGTVAAPGWERLFASFTPVGGKTYELRLLHAAGAATRVVFFDDASVKQFVSQDAAGDPDAIFAVAFTSEVGNARDARLREAFMDSFAEWVPEPR